VIFHVAAVGTGNWQAQYSVNVEGTHNVIEAAQQAGAERYVHVSSIAVYGYEVAGRIDENYPQRPPRNDYYMRTKAEGERLVWEAAASSKLLAVAVRPAFVYGPGSQTWSKGYYSICKRFGYITLAGGRGNAHPIFVDDVIDLLVTVATHPAAPGHAFHAAPDPAVTWRDFLGYYARMTGKTREWSILLPPPLILKPLADTLTLLGRSRGLYNDVYGVLRFVTRNATFSMDKARTLLGWQPRTSLDEGMIATEKWLKQTGYDAR
jgi:nucleoside-diphosphate-sugar epimerase